MTHIILTDDDRNLREILALYLDRNGYIVHQASDGSEALALYAQHADAVIVIDMIMPGMEGMETILAFARLHPKARIIAISGGGRISGVSLLKMASHIGASATLAKPFHPDDLVKMIKEVLEAPPK